MIDNGKEKRIMRTIQNNEQTEKIKMFTKANFKKANGDLVFSAVHVETGRKVEVKFYNFICVLVVERKRNIANMPKNAKLWDCLAKLEEMAQNPDY